MEGGQRYQVKDDQDGCIRRLRLRLNHAINHCRWTWHFRKSNPQWKTVYGTSKAAKDAGKGCKGTGDHDALKTLELNLRNQFKKAELSRPAKATVPAANQPTISSFFRPKAEYASKEACEEATEAVAFGIIESGLPAVLLRKPAFVAMLVKAANAGPDWKPPSSETLRTTLLDKVI